MVVLYTNTNTVRDLAHIHTTCTCIIMTCNTPTPGPSAADEGPCDTCIHVQPRELIKSCIMCMCGSARFYNVHVCMCTCKHDIHCTPLIAQVVGKTLLDCVSGIPCEWAVARALDALYDVFGADECPVQLFSTLQIMPILEKASSQLNSRVSIIHVTHVVCSGICPYI